MRKLNRLPPKYSNPDSMKMGEFEGEILDDE
jgi:hypothetical protein